MSGKEKWYLSYLRWLLIVSILFASFPIYASFIEATIGTAVVNDATATYYNPAALTLLNNPQFIALGSFAYLKTQFSGQATQLNTGFTQTGTSYSNTNYFLPSMYFAVPTNRITLGIALIANDFNREIDSNSILRYVQSNNHIQDTDVISALGFKVADQVALGAGIIFSHAQFEMEPISGIPSLNIPDSQSHNQSSGNSIGGDIGLLLTPSATTTIGFDYRSQLTYTLQGNSSFNGISNLTTNNYRSKYWTPARGVSSINHSITKQLGIIGTIQYIQWNVFNQVNIYNVVTQINSQPVILPNTTVIYHFHNTWLFTLGTHYRISPTWIVRVAGSYNQSPSNGNYQIGTGDSIILGGSMGYQFFKNIILDGSYAHAFINNRNININTGSNSITGVNKASRDAISLKVIINI